MTLKVDIEKCTGCGTCVENCPVEAIKLVQPVGVAVSRNAVAVIDEDTCIECGMCVDECPESAIITP